MHRRPITHIILVWTVSSVACLLSSPAHAITRCDVLDDAQSWVDNAVPYHLPDACPGPLYCDPLRGGECFRSDCSGFVSAAWGLGGPGLTTYRFAGGSLDEGISTVISPGELLPGDALNFPGNISAGTGHIMLYVSGDFSSGWIQVYEEMNCGYVAMLHWKSIDPSMYFPIRYEGIEPCCTPHCEGSMIVDADCVRYDCAGYGAGCVDDYLGVRCVFYACPPIGDVDVCIDEDTFGSCSNGSLVTQINCADFAALCSVAGGGPAHCASVFCVSSPTEVPVEHDLCYMTGERYHCDGSGVLIEADCPGGQKCSVYPEVHCEADLGCPAEGDVTICYEDRIIARCMGGGIVQVLGDCGLFAAFCSTAGDTEPHCASAFCVESADDVPEEHMVCLLDGKIARCTSDGGLEEGTDCPDGEVCLQEPDGARCGQQPDEDTIEPVPEGELPSEPGDSAEFMADEPADAASETPDSLDGDSGDAAQEAGQEMTGGCGCTIS